jgi:hypothetical protein
VEQREHGESFGVGDWCDLLDLEALADYVLVGYHHQFCQSY